VPEQSWLDVLRRQWLAQERVVEQVDLSDRQVVVRPPPRVERSDLVVARASQFGDQVVTCFGQR
jgi:hypothetical protein